MATITWDETLPVDPDALSAGAAELRSLKSNLRAGLEESRYWTDGASMASAGEMKLGSLRAGYGAMSTLSATGDNGHLSVNWRRTTGAVASRYTYDALFAPTSSVTTHRVGGQLHLEHPQSVITGARWVLSSGTTTLLAATGAYSLSFGVVYNGIPRAWCNHCAIGASTTEQHLVYPSAVTAGGMTISKLTMPPYYGGVQQVSYVAWVSLGTVSF